MSRNVLVLLLVAHIYQVVSFPSQSKTTKNVIHVSHTNEPPEVHTISSNRKKKGPNIPSLQTQYQILVPNLHVVPLSHVIPVLIPTHNLSPVHDLTVIPLHKVSEPMISYRVHDEEDRFRNPLGGYGVGWQFGGHGAGHGYHYSYG